MDPIEQGARLMASRRTGALPVVDDGRVLGLLTASDVVRACATLLGAGEGGARVLVSGGRDADLLDTIARRSHGLVIRALTARRTPGGGWEAVLRLRGRLSSPRPEGEEQCA
jgi:CBS domain-containing protein